MAPVMYILSTRIQQSTLLGIITGIRHLAEQGETEALYVARETAGEFARVIQIRSPPRVWVWGCACVRVLECVCLRVWVWVCVPY